MAEIFKDDIARKLSDRRGITEAEAKRRLEDIKDLIVDELIDGNTVKWAGFFNFFPKIRKQKDANNPQTGVFMIIPETKTILARMTKPLKDLVQGKKVKN